MAALEMVSQNTAPQIGISVLSDATDIAGVLITTSTEGYDFIGLEML